MSAPTTGRYAFLTNPRWLGLIALMAAVSLACVFLGRWQWTRFEERSADSRQVNAVYDAAPEPLMEALPTLTVRPATLTVRPADEWRPVELTGHYVDDATVVLRNRPVDGNAAAHLVTPFVASGRGGNDLVVVVDRGWIPADRADELGADLPAPPSGEVRLTGRLRLAEDPAGRARPTGQMYTLAPEEVLASAAEVTDLTEVAGLPVLDGHVLAAKESPAPSEPLGGYARPAFNYGMNLSYTIQWGLFSVAALAAVVVLARREAADRSGRGPVRTLSRAEFEEDLEVYQQLRATTALPGGSGGSGGSGVSGVSGGSGARLDRAELEGQGRVIEAAGPDPVRE
ncbi:SURF1 family protein [Georgenia yuyongxinii]|uniref:SURF1-like protein n=1 Tax=Georgenia yuyongxinii TaxID=2589797 RepID=A0A552WSY8_9MICO|nr:SURF1 family protein [Georgenia yuyongxinii]TRW45729.1 SURF1 family protein [Georgenia yuyongxinii]